MAPGAAEWTEGGFGSSFSHGEIKPPNINTPVVFFILRGGGRLILGGSDYIYIYMHIHIYNVYALTYMYTSLSFSGSDDDVYKVQKLGQLPACTEPKLLVVSNFPSKALLV